MTEMKKTKIFLIALLFLPTALYAMTAQWNYFCTNEIIQVKSDGGGGCVFVERDTNDVQTLTWLDKKGAVFYRTVLVTNMTSPIVFCTKKQLAYRDATPLSTIIIIDNKKKKTVMEVPGKNVQVPFFNMILPRNVTTDRKGFFGFRIIPNEKGQTIIRYKN